MSFGGGFYFKFFSLDCSPPQLLIVPEARLLFSMLWSCTTLVVPEFSCKLWYIYIFFLSCCSKIWSEPSVSAHFLAVSRTCYTRRCCVIIPSLWWRLSKYWWITAQRMCTNRMLRMLATHIDKIYRLSIRLLAFHLFNVSSLCSAPLPFSHDVFFFHAMLGILIWAALCELWEVLSESLVLVEKLNCG